MLRLLAVVSKISRWMNNISSVVLAFMILLTVADVTLRLFRRPIIGTYEIVALSGAVIIGFSIPLTSLMRAHVNVDFFILKLSPGVRKVFNLVTKCLGVGLFLILGWNLFILGEDLYKAGEVTPTRHIPFYPILFGIGICCFFQCLVLLYDLINLYEGRDG